MSLDVAKVVAYVEIGNPSINQLAASKVVAYIEIAPGTGTRPKVRKKTKVTAQIIYPDAI